MAILLAVAAHVRHTKTNYDELLMRGVDRATARTRVKAATEAVLEAWRQG